MSTDNSNRRFNPLTQEWVLVSNGRQARPWTGKFESQVDTKSLIPYVEECALCPGNMRVTGKCNPNYLGVYVFDNDFPALTKSFTPEHSADEHALFKSQADGGYCKVVCFSEDHSLALAQMSLDEIADIIECWIAETESLAADRNIRHVQIFENRGETMGCSNPHPHGQIWAQQEVPTIPNREAHRMAEYYRSHGRTLLSDYLAEELRRKDRIVCENEGFVVLVPYWAAWPFETLIIPRRPVSLLSELSAESVYEFADAIRRISARYDNLFATSFPYSSGIHQRPVNYDIGPSYHLHMHYFPPLLRSASVRKFMVGYEMLAESQRDFSPEEAAFRLRGQPDVHYMSESRDDYMQSASPSES